MHKIRVGRIMNRLIRKAWGSFAGIAGYIDQCHGNTRRVFPAPLFNVCLIGVLFLSLPEWERLRTEIA